MEHFISRWDITPNGDLRITVASRPLGMAKTFTWKYHSTNHYGQGAKYTWWETPSGSGPPEIEVTGEAAELLTRLVYAHEPLNKLVEYFKMMDPEGYR